MSRVIEDGETVKIDLNSEPRTCHFKGIPTMELDTLDGDAISLSPRTFNQISKYKARGAVMVELSVSGKKGTVERKYRFVGRDESMKEVFVLEQMAEDGILILADQLQDLKKLQEGEHDARLREIARHLAAEMTEKELRHSKRLLMALGLIASAHQLEGMTNRVREAFELSAEAYIDYLNSRQTVSGYYTPLLSDENQIVNLLNQAERFRNHKEGRR